MNEIGKWVDKVQKNTLNIQTNGAKSSEILLVVAHVQKRVSGEHWKDYVVHVGTYEVFLEHLAKFRFDPLADG